ncbi:MAG TPA: hypothetical protein VHE35_09860 [Kofleriaceae bacterium]|nr:hypothetical protein [Kofleriaceae bacterium]
MKIARTLAPAALGMTLVMGCARSSASHPPAADRHAPGSTSTLDKRTPLPLSAMMADHQKQEMRDHLRVVQEIAGALAVEDYGAIATSAARIGWSDREAMMCKHMGAGAPGFAEVGEAFHRTADSIVVAAQRHDRAGVAASLAATLQKCVGCHETYRQEIVADAVAPSAAAMTGDAPADCPMHGK